MNTTNITNITNIENKIKEVLMNELTLLSESEQKEILDNLDNLGQAIGSDLAESLLNQKTTKERIKDFDKEVRKLLKTKYPRTKYGGNNSTNGPKDRERHSDILEPKKYQRLLRIFLDDLERSTPRGTYGTQDICEYPRLRYNMDDIIRDIMDLPGSDIILDTKTEQLVEIPYVTNDERRWADLYDGIFLIKFDK